MLHQKLSTLIILSLMTVSWAKSNGYAYQRNDNSGLKKSTIAYTIPQEQEALLPQEQAKYAHHQQQTSYEPAQENYKTEFYTFSAPEEDFEDVNAAQKVATAVQKNVHVVFIRAPEQKGLEHAALQLAKQALDQKTAIYVLNKQHDVEELAQRFTAHREQYAHKPEVHFVKYRTTADAERAQEQIQAKYNLLGGITHTSNEDAAPVFDFAYKQQPSYDSAISIVPAYNLGSGGSNTNGLYNQPPSAASVPAYNIGSSSSSGNGLSNSNLYTQQLLSNSAAATPSYSSSLQSNEFETAPENFVSLNLLKTHKSQIRTQSFNANSLGSSNIDSYATIGSTSDVYSHAGNGDVSYPNTGNSAGPESLGLGPSFVDNGAASALEAYGVSPRIADRKIHKQIKPAFPKLNERRNKGNKFVFPSDERSTNTYLPPKKKSLF